MLLSTHVVQLAAIYIYICTHVRAYIHIAVCIYTIHVCMVVTHSFTAFLVGALRLLISLSPASTLLALVVALLMQVLVIGSSRSCWKRKECPNTDTRSQNDARSNATLASSRNNSIHRQPRTTALALVFACLRSRKPVERSKLLRLHWRLPLAM